MDINTDVESMELLSISNSVHEIRVEPNSQNHELLEAAKGNLWPKVFNLIDGFAKSHEFFTTKFDINGKSILHYACDICNKKTARNIVEKILSRRQISVQHTIKFINHADSEKRTALHVAADRANKGLVELFIKFGADVNLRMNDGTQAITLIYRNVPRAILNIFDHCLKINVLGDEDEHDREFWEVDCDISPVAGLKGPSESKWKEDSILPQTKLLSQSLKQNQLKRSEVLLHPLTQIFLELKREKFSKLIWISIAYHITWSLACVSFFFINTPNLQRENRTSNGNSSTNESGNAKRGPEESPVSGSHLFLMIVFGIFFTITSAKEILETVCCPNKKYYWKQLENIGQWFLLICVLTQLIIKLILRILQYPNDATYLVYVPAVGIFMSSVLILGQLNKFKHLAIYMEILVTVLKRIFWFFVVFSPLLGAFILTFNVLMPNMDQFAIGTFPFGATKLLSMMTGEVNYDDTFHPEDKSEDSVIEPILTKCLFLVFIVVVAIVLQNLLIGLSISDIQVLQKQAEEIQLASQLEQMYLLEATLLSEPAQRLIKHCGKTQWLEKLIVTKNDTQKKILKENDKNSANFWANKQLKDYSQHIRGVIIDRVVDKDGNLKSEFRMHENHLIDSRRK